ncbi:radical SAM protein [Ktedonosporobacter rubrisoli]|uniref:Radical SAM protein n=2 Tax=Ktedonosporobacter rubrisoli TaxID=2509675 RepID=A0A4P6K711_KTERU|nr:radical SAM protein [Ktedonosporobacter rubrisoli]
MNIKEIETKTMLVPSKLPDAQYVVNPYTGCEFGCAYCYASFMGRFVNEPVNNWGNYVYVKTNAVSVFEKDLKRWSQARRQSSIFLSSVTDPYHGIESKYRLTRGILEILARETYPGLVSILTKSPLVLRDVDILHQIPHVEVGMTITTTDDKLGRFLEVRAPLISRRLHTLKQLHEEGLHTYAFIGPLLPHFRYRPDLLEDLFARLAEVGVQSVFIEHINLKPYIRERLLQRMQHESPEIQDVYRQASSLKHREILDRLVTNLVEKYQLRLRLNRVLYHNQNMPS